MTIRTDVTRLEPGALIELFHVDAQNISGEQLYFHGYTEVGPITWQGIEYDPWPVEAEGFELTGDRPPQPRLSVGNTDGRISAVCAAGEDIVGAIVTRHRTLGKYLDAVNFEGGVNPDADPTQEMPVDVWIVERKARETAEVVQFELSSALNFGGVQLPRRQIVAGQCPWLYRGVECGYTGLAVADAHDVPTSSLADDRCGKRLASCKLRFGEDVPLPFGGFPAASLTR